AHPLVPFFDLHRRAMRKERTSGVTADKRTCVVSIRLDDESIAVPPPHVVSIESVHRRIARQFAPVCPDRPPGMTPFKELENPGRRLNEFHSIVVSEGPYSAEGVTMYQRIVHGCTGLVWLIRFFHEV